MCSLCMYSVFSPHCSYTLVSCRIRINQGSLARILSLGGKLPKGILERSPRKKKNLGIRSLEIVSSPIREVKSCLHLYLQK